MLRVSAVARSLAYATNRPSGEISPSIVKPGSQVKRLNAPGIVTAGGLLTLTRTYETITATATSANAASDGQLHREYEDCFGSAAGSGASMTASGGTDSCADTQ